MLVEKGHTMTICYGHGEILGFEEVICRHITDILSPAYKCFSTRSPDLAITKLISCSLKNMRFRKFI